jgi:hypothetical protein
MIGPGERGTARRVFLALLALALIAALVYWALGKQQFDWRALGDSIRHARVSLILLSVVAIYACYAIRALRWSRFCRYVGAAPFPGVYASTLVGFTALFLLGRAGEPIRPLLIARKHRLSISSQFGIYVLERIFDSGATAVLAGISLLGFAHLAVGPGNEELLTKARAAGVLLLAGFAGAIAFLIYFRLHGAEWMKNRFAHWHQRTGWHAKVAGMLDGLSQGLQAIRTFGDLAAAVGLSVAHWLLVVVVYQGVPASFGGRLAEIDFPAAMLVLVFSMVGSMIQLPAVGGGSQVACFVAFTRLFGIDTEPAAAASITLWLVTFAGCIVAGIPLLIREGFSMAELRRLAQAEKEAEAHGEHLREVPAPHGRQSGE